VSILKKLLATADVFVTNVRQQGLARLGLTYEALKNEFPALVYAHLTAFGRKGPLQNDAGYVY
jgi:crotonobetainyl-CoA:carnitine CoA-transferase CaiB-like acyl-CoA transferase